PNCTSMFRTKSRRQRRPEPRLPENRSPPIWRTSSSTKLPVSGRRVFSKRSSAAGKVSRSFDRSRAGPSAVMGFDDVSARYERLYSNTERNVALAERSLASCFPPVGAAFLGRQGRTSLRCQEKH